MLTTFIMVTEVSDVPKSHLQCDHMSSLKKSHFHSPLQEKHINHVIEQPNIMREK